MKFLIVEDDPILRLILKKTLEDKGYKVILAKDGQEGWEIFQKEKEEIYLAIIDWIMPRMDGLSLCQKIRKSKVSHYVYIIFLSAKTEKDDIITGLDVGADDYLTKPLEVRELLCRIKVGLRIIELEQKLREINQKLQILALTNGLTGILNRRAVLERFREEIYRAIREKWSLGVIMIDIDHFKKINDTYGHVIGDKVLKEVVNRLRSKLRPYDIIGRYGGEEFLVIIPKITGKSLYEVGERLRKSVCEESFKVDSETLTVTISLGATWVKLPKKIDVEMLIEDAIKVADKALYKAKDQGRNQVVLISMN